MAGEAPIPSVPLYIQWLCQPGSQAGAVLNAAHTLHFSIPVVPRSANIFCLVRRYASQPLEVNASMIVNQSNQEILNTVGKLAVHASFFDCISNFFFNLHISHHPSLQNLWCFLSFLFSQL